MMHEMVPGLDLGFLHLAISVHYNELRRSVITFSVECNIVKLFCYAEIQKFVTDREQILKLPVCIHTHVTGFS